MITTEDFAAATPHVARSMAGVVHVVLCRRPAGSAIPEPVLLELDGICQQMRRGRELSDFATASMFTADPGATARHFGDVIDRVLQRRGPDGRATVAISAADVLSCDSVMDVRELRARSFADALGESARRVGDELRSLREAVEASAISYRLVPIRRSSPAGTAYLTIDQEFSAQARRIGVQAGRLLFLGADIAAPADERRWRSVAAMHDELHREFSQVDALLTGLRGLLRQCDRDAYFSGVGPRFPFLRALPVETCGCGSGSPCGSGDDEAPDLPLSTARAVTRALRLGEASRSTRAEIRAALL